jgi:hypothetical protein
MSENTAKKSNRQFWQKGVGRAVKYVFVACLLALVLAVITGISVPLEFAFQLLVGWFLFLMQNTSSIKLNGEMILCGCGALVLAIWGGHRLLVWVRNGRVWKWSWTLSLTAMMLMLFVSSVAMTGVIHQTAWMSSEPLTENNRRGRLIHNTSNAKQLFMLFVEYDQDYNQLPESLGLLEKEGYTKDLELFQFRPNHGRSTEAWIYLGSGQRFDDDTEGVNPSRVLLISPSPIRDRWIILLSNGAVKQIRASGLRQKYPEVLRRLPNLLPSEQ